MFRMVFGSYGKTGTCKVKQHASGSKQEEFSAYTMKTLGSGDVLGTLFYDVCSCDL